MTTDEKLFCLLSDRPLGYRVETPGGTYVTVERLGRHDGGYYSNVYCHWWRAVKENSRRPLDNNN